MSAILSADDLNDFISPGVACIKPVETLPKNEDKNENLYEVTTEDKVEAQNPTPAQISLTDCLACSGCVTSAEAVLVSLQSHAEVLNTLDANPEIRVSGQENGIKRSSGAEVSQHPESTLSSPIPQDGKIFVASVSPQVRASLAATYGISELKAGYMIDQFLSGPDGLRAGGNHGSGFTWVIDTNVMRQAVLELSTAEVSESLKNNSTSIDPSSGNKFPVPSRPILSSACPGWICYVEKTHPHVIPHLSRLKSPQALTGTFLKTILSKALNVSPSRIWHLAIMPCFDKKLEASRQELTDISWQPTTTDNPETIETPTRDVDCVITSRELLMLASSRNISLPGLPHKPIPPHFAPTFPDQRIAPFLFPKRRIPSGQSSSSGPSGGYLHHLLTTYQSQNPDSTIQAQRGRNADVVEYTLVSAAGDPIMKAARYYGFRNIQNLVRRLKPPRPSRLPGAKPVKSALTPTSNRRGANGLVNRPSSTRNPNAADFAYVEVMACPGGCTNGGGQITVEDATEANSALTSSSTTTPATSLDPTHQEPQKPRKPTPQEQRAWLSRVDEAYYSADSEEEGKETPIPDYPLNAEEEPSDSLNSILKYWSDLMNIPLPKLIYTTFLKVESDVGKSSKSLANGVGDTARVAELAGKAGGGW